MRISETEIRADVERLQVLNSTLVILLIIGHAIVINCPHLQTCGLRVDEQV
jgi:hypothetical protein